MPNAAFVTLSFATIASLLAGLLSAARQLAFKLRARRVQGQVTSEWRYRRYGRERRYYRVEFTLSTGQRAELRSAWSSSPSSAPKVGQQVVVLVNEQPGQAPKARIGSWAELWMGSALLLALGAIGSLALVFVGGPISRGGL